MVRRRVTPLVVAGVTAAALLVSCAGPESAGPPITTTLPTSPVTTAPPRAPATTTTTPTTDAATLTLAFGGDVHFEEYLAPLARDPDGLSGLIPTLGAADLSVVNLETAITERGTPIGKEFHFRAPASALVTLQRAGVDAVSMANNHGADFGSVGLADTLAAKATSPVPIAGIGADEDEAFAPVTLEAKGVRVALLAASQVFEMTLANWSADADSPGIASASPVTRLREAVRAAAATHDVVVVFMHWGLDYQACPDRLSTQTADALTDAGADIVVGGHSHRVNGAGWTSRSYVAYGLGNFVWWRSQEPDSRTGVLTLDVDVAAATAAGTSTTPVVRDATWTPMLIGSGGVPLVASGATRDRLMDVWEKAHACSGLADSPG